MGVHVPGHEGGVVVAGGAGQRRSPCVGVPPRTLRAVVGPNVAGMARFEIETVAYHLVYEEEAAFKDTYGGVEGVVVCESYLIRPKDLATDTVLVFMHPVGGGAYLPMVRQLAKEGHHVIYCTCGYRPHVTLT